MFSHRKPAPVALMIATLALTACASTVPKAQFTHELAAKIGSADTVKVSVDGGDGVTITPEERERIAAKIFSKVDARKEKNAGASPPGAYEVDLRLTRYEKGSATARFFLVGLGQIHIDGTVAMFKLPEHTPAGEFTLQKTFAWGGIYGAATSVEDIESTFADGVAAAVTGQQEETPKSKN